MPDEPDVAARTFVCADCGERAGTVRLVRSGDGLVIHVSSFTSNLTTGLSKEREADFVAAMDSAKALFEVDLELAPFFCPRCDCCYCGKHWRHWDVFDDDGWHDSIRGVCPRGHERMLED